MKHLIALILCIIYIINVSYAQTSYCGLTYYYDASGNRIQRIVTSDCTPYSTGPGGGDGSRMLMIVNDSSNSQSLTEALYPNPTTGPVRVVFNTPVSEAQITVTDNLGRELYSTTASGSSIPLDISRFAEGLYFVVVRMQGNTYQSTVVKQ